LLSIYYSLLFFVIVVWRCTTGYFTSGK